MLRFAQRPLSGPAGPDSGRCAKRSIAALYGRIDVARAYGDRASVHGGVRAGLQNSGVQLVDTGAHSNDRSPILIDMFDYALGRPAPATVVLLLGGLPRERFGLALRRLAERGYCVVLVRPADSLATAFDGACHASHDGPRSARATRRTSSPCASSAAGARAGQG